MNVRIHAASAASLRSLGSLLIATAAVAATVLLSWASPAKSSVIFNSDSNVVQHFSVLQFSVRPGSSHTFQLPVTTPANAPIDVKISESDAGGTLQPSPLVRALVFTNTNHILNWIGTNNDGSQKGGSAIAGTTVAQFFCVNQSCVNTTLSAVSSTSLNLAVNSQTESDTEHFVVSMTY